MVIHKVSTRFTWSWPWWRWIMTGLNLIALALSTLLSWHQLTGGSMIGCGVESPCEQVLNSQWSMIAHILPVSGLAVGVYLAMLFTVFFIGPDTEAPIRRLAWSMMLILAGAVAGSAIWFTILQKWIIGDFCPYCMTAHITGFLLAFLIIWRAVKEPGNQSGSIPETDQVMDKNVPANSSGRGIRRLPAIGLVLIGLIPVGILAAGQIIFSPPSVYREGESKDNPVIIDFHKAPIVGSPDAPYKVILLFDYQCSHCQKLHFLLDEVILRYKGKLAFALCPAPLNTECNPYIPRDADAFKNSCELARIGLAVWLARRDAFPDFENWMFTFESGNFWQPRSPEAARAKAIELAGQANFDSAMTDPWIGQYMKTSIRIFGQTLQEGNGGIPRLIFGSRWVIPQIQNADDLVMILQKGLGVPAP